ncbi:MAG TPA: Xaa-Pro dipeptidase [Polyangiales bacterium]|nr:Xaa-Pro dipeptidase [Polyangiales bacterium]
MDQQALRLLYSEHVRQLEGQYGAILTAHGYDSVVIHSGLPKWRTEFDDQQWPLRVTPHFQHWLPLAEADCALIVAPGQRPKLLWIQPGSFWEQPAALPELDWQGEFEIVTLTTPDAAKELMPGGRSAFIGEERGRAADWGFVADNVSPKALVEELDQLRTKKSGYEVVCLAEANRRAALGHRALADAFRTGEASELELHLLFLRATEQDDPETPYKNIVALGRNAATLHHVSYRKTPERGGASQSMLVDAGATYLGYCSDITRTYVKGSGAGASGFAGVVSRVESFQQQLCAAVSVGNKYEALHDHAHRLVGQTLFETGVSRLSVDEAVATGVTRAFFPHGLGHSLGLQCHDVGCALIKPRPDNPFLRNTTSIAVDQCFTVEPGIYFIDGLLAKLRAEPQASSIDWGLVDELATFGGVRIEDDLVVTGGANVTRNLTREHLG